MQEPEECCKKAFPGLLGSLADTAKRVIQKPTIASAEQQKERLDICGTCENYVDSRCKLCGCFMKLKVKAGNVRCPDDPPKWIET
jgi:hypothetical protein